MRIAGNINPIRPRMQQMDVWSRDHVDPLNKKKKIELRQSAYKSSGFESNEQTAPAGWPFLRRAPLWPILGTALLPPLPPMHCRDRGNGKNGVGSNPGDTGNLRFPLDYTYHGCRSRKKPRERRFELRNVLISRCVAFRFLTFYEVIKIEYLKIWSSYVCGSP